MRYSEKRDAALTKANTLIAQRKAAGQELSDDDRAALTAYRAEIDDCNEKITKLNADAKIIAAFDKLSGGTGTPDGSTPDDSEPGKGYSRAAVKATAHQIVKSIATRNAAVMLDDSLTKGTLVLDGGTDVPVLDLVALPQRPITLFDALPVRRLTSPTFKYVRQTSRTNNATVVAKGATKPTSQFGFETITGELKVIAHLSDAIDKYVLSDVRDLERVVTGEMQFGLFAGAENQIINGNGTAPNMRGLLNTSGIQTQAFAANIVSTIRTAVTKLESLGYVPNVIALRPDDWEKIETSVTAGSGEYIMAASPVDRAAMKLWGVPVILSTALPAGKALLLDKDSVEVLSDSVVAADWDTSTGFAKNEVYLRVESRFELAVTRPMGIVSISTSA